MQTKLGRQVVVYVHSSERLTFLLEVNGELCRIFFPIETLSDRFLARLSLFQLDNVIPPIPLIQAPVANNKKSNGFGIIF
jgi:hypothetical protein